MGHLERLRCLPEGVARDTVVLAAVVGGGRVLKVQNTACTSSRYLDTVLLPAYLPEGGSGFSDHFLYLHGCFWLGFHF